MKFSTKLLAIILLVLSLAACVNSRVAWNSESPVTYKATVTVKKVPKSRLEENRMTKRAVAVGIRKAAQLSSSPAISINIGKRKNRSNGFDQEFTGSIAELGKRIYFFGSLQISNGKGMLYFTTADSLQLARAGYY
ncbi:MAG: hypothetical protein AAGA50_05405, partial [Pseudomonadota bacterium]